MIINLTLRCSVDSGRRAKGILLQEQTELSDSSYITGDAIMKLLKQNYLTSGYFALGYTPFIAIDGRKIGLPVRKSKDLCNWEILKSKTIIEMPEKLVNIPIDIAMIQPSNSLNFLKNNGAIEIRSSTASNDKSILQPNAEYFGCGIVGDSSSIELPKHQALWQAAYNFNASYIYTVDNGMENCDNKKKKRTLKKQTLSSKKLIKVNGSAKSTNKPWEFVPSFFYSSIEDFTDCAAYNCPWIACCEGDGATPLETFKHPSRCVYLFGDLPPGLVTRCAFHVLPPACSNKDSIGSMVMYDRYYKRKRNELELAKQMNKRISMESGIDNGNHGSDFVEGGKKRTNSHGKRKLRTKGVDAGNYKSLKMNSIRMHGGNSSVTANKRLGICAKYINAKDIDPQYLNNNEFKVVIFCEKVFTSRIILYMKTKFSLHNYYVKDGDKMLFDIDVESGPSMNSKKQNVLTKLLNDPIPARAIQTLYCVTNAAKDFDTMCTLIVKKILSMGSITIRIQAKPNTLGVKVIEKLPSSIILNPKEFTHVLNIAHNVVDDTYLFGVVSRDLNFISSAGFSQSINLYKQRHISKSYYKLWEIHARGHIVLKKETTCVLNVGGAPGWSEYLTLHAKHVTSISNKVLHAELQKCTNVEHLKMRSGDGMASYKRLKGIGEDQMQLPKYDIILANLNCSPPQAINTITLFSKLLKDTGGIFVLILKLPASIRHETAKKFYMDCLVKKKIHQVDDVFLFTNSAKETTFIMRR